MKLLVSILLWGLSVPTFAQFSTFNWPGSEHAVSAAGIQVARGDFAAIAPTKSQPTSAAVLADDSLWSKRNFFTTTIHSKAGKLSNTTLREMFQAAPKTLVKYRWGQILQPVGPLVSVAGVAVAYNGLKGHKEISYVRGPRTPTNANPSDVKVEYTVRSLPKILGGLGLFISGICLFELSHELIAKSARQFTVRYSYNNKRMPPKLVKLGLTTSGNLGLEAQF